MNHVSDQWLEERFAPLRLEDEPVEWRQISRRARRVSPRAAMLIVGVVAVIALSAPALGWHRTVINWLDADGAPRKVQLEFAQLGVGAPPGYELGIEHEQARTVTSVTHAGKTYVLSVAPTKGGGFCFWWKGSTTSCRQERTPPPDFRERSSRDLHSFRLGATWMPDEQGVIQSAAGSLIGSDAEHLFAIYADGDRVEIPVTWVSEPIDAGFYFYFTPAEHLRAGKHMTALEAATSSGEIVGRQTVELTPANEILRSVRLPDGIDAMLPAKAIVSKAVKLIDFPASNGRRVTLWEMPSTDGGVCFATKRSSGCPPGPHEVPMDGPGLAGGSVPVLVETRTRADVAEVALRFEDGTEKRIRPIKGYVLTELPPRNYARGHRLVQVIALGADGVVLAKHPVNPASKGLYPCEHPVDRGYGVTMCP
jgi:hypothetical protein